MVHRENGSTKGFTIVELLIVIVVIGILAAITIVAYNGISARASAAGVQSDLESAAKTIENSRTTNASSAYPADQTAAQTAGVSSTITYSAAMSGYCATKSSSNGTVYMVTGTNPKPHTGPGCTLTNLVTNPSFEAATTGWSSASNVTFARSTTYAATGTASATVRRNNATAGNGYIFISIATTAGTKYAVSFAIRATNLTPTVNATVKNAVAGTIPADADQLVITPTTSFTRYTVSWTAESSSTNFLLDMPSGVTAQEYAVDSIFAVAGDNAGAYADPLMNPGVWTWTGTTNASTSTGPAF